MKTKTAALICICLGAICFMLAIYKSENWPILLISLAIAAIGILVAITYIVRKEQANKRIFYYAILVIGVLFLLLGFLK
jgi:4-hydroxybenzoate polyprenyltransferase